MQNSNGMLFQLFIYDIPYVIEYWTDLVDQILLRKRYLDQPMALHVAAKKVFQHWSRREPMFISGWGDLLKRTSDSGKVASIGDATPALLMVMIIFALPTNYKFWPFQSRNLPSGRSPSLVNWEMIEKKLPWGVILLLGGGFALSDACTKTGEHVYICFNRLFL